MITDYAAHASPSLAILQSNTEHWNKTQKKEKSEHLLWRNHTFHNLRLLNKIMHLYVTLPSPDNHSVLILDT